MKSDKTSICNDRVKRMRSFDRRGRIILPWSSKVKEKETGELLETFER
jgi:hypothetical protein